MRTTLIWLCTIILSILVTGGQTADINNAASIDMQSMGPDIREFVTPDGHIDFEALKASGYKGTIDLRGIDIGINSISGELTLQVSQAQALADHPDDIYWDNSVSPSLAGVGGEVNAAIVYDEKLIIGGGFRAAGDQIVNYIAMWDGNSWSPLASGMDGPVLALAVYDGKLIAGGQFTLAGGTEVNNIASWDGTAWSPMGSGADLGVYALTLFNGKLIAAGIFSIDGSDTITLATWDGTTWLPLAVTNGPVESLAEYNGNLIAGGKFTAIDGVTAYRIACWDGSDWTPLGLGMEGSNVPYVHSLAVYDGQLIAGGYFNTAGSVAARNIASWDGTDWSPVGAGTTGYVKALYVYDGNIIAGGWFYQAGDIYVYGIASWNGNAWSAIGSGLSGFAESITEYNGKLIVGGDFSMAGETPAMCIAAWNGYNWSSFSLGMDLFISALAVFDGKLIAGGYFASIGDILANRIASYDGNKWEALGSGMSNAPGWSDNVEALAIYDGKLIAGGYFYYADGIQVNHIASWDGIGWSPMGGEELGSVRALAVLDDVLYAAGMDNVSFWDGASWIQLGSDFDDNVYAIAKYDGKLVAGGWFRNVGDVEVNCIASWDGTAWSPMGSGFTGSGDGTKVECLAVYEDMLIAGGQFRTTGDVTVNDLACWDGSKWFPIAGWKGTNSVSTMHVYNGKLFVGGSFFTSYGSPGNCIAAWDGATWSELGSGVNRAVLALTPFEGKLAVGGTFRIAGNKVAGALAMWTKPLTMTVAKVIIRPVSWQPFDKIKRNSGKINCWIGNLPGDYNVSDINVESIRLNETVSPIVGKSKIIMEHEEFDGQVLRVPFDRYDAITTLSSNEPGIYEIEITGSLTDGTVFSGTTEIKLPGQQAVESREIKTIRARLHQNQPNPFNPITELSFELPARSEVTLEIYNIAGQKIAVLCDGILEAGPHSFIWNAGNVASGIYLYRLKTGEYTEKKKMLLLK